MLPTFGAIGSVYFLAEAPGKDEDEVSGKPLTGPSGKLVRECIPKGFERDCSFDNVCSCRPPQNRTPVFAEIEACRPRHIKFIEQAKPKIIIGMGVVPLQWMTDSTDMQGMRGRLFAVKIGQHSCYFMPTYHPAFILRKAQNKHKPLNSMMGHCFRMDIKRAFDWAPTLETPIIDTEADVKKNIQCFDGSPGQFEPLLALLKEARKAPIKAIDIETRFLRPYAEGAGLMTVALSFSKTNFSFSVHHPKSQWNPLELAEIKARLFDICVDDTIKIAHNAPFEIEWFIWFFGKNVVNHGAWECTMMQAHFLDERKGGRRDDDSTGASRYQALDFLCKQHFGIAYKSLFKLNKKDMSKSDQGETLIYNAVDTKYTLRLYYKQFQLLKESGLLEAYADAVPRQPTVALMQSIGVDVDQAFIKDAQNKLGPQIEGLEGSIKELAVVKQFIAEQGEFSPYSNPNIISIFRDYLKRKEVTLEGEGKRFSADKNILDSIDHPLAQMIVDLRNRSKMKSTYVDRLELGSENPIIFPNGKIHTSFNTTLTETGRLSSDSVNLQNFPKRKDAWLRGSVIPPLDHLFVAIDYGQLEACTIAMCSKDPFLVKALWEDYDVHMEWAERTAHGCPELVGGVKNLKDKAAMKEFRSLIKNKLCFPAFFGASNESVLNYLTNATGHDPGQPFVDDIMDQFWGSFEGVLRWQKATMNKYYDVGYVETLGGRRRHYPLTKNQAINQPAQGTAAELVCDAMCRLSHISLTSGRSYLHPVLNIHDDLSMFVPKTSKVFDEALEIMIREMLTFDFAWINVPLAVEVSVGENWSNVKPIGKFFSHKDL